MTSLILVDVQLDSDAVELADESDEPPTGEQLRNWTRVAYAACHSRPAEVTLRLVGEDEMTSLNEQYRGKVGATNVLSFPFDTPDHITEELSATLLGDVVICHPVVVAEAKQQNKDLTAHYAHMVTHGVLHLCGYDHQHEAEATTMENLETNILTQQGFNNPYEHYNTAKVE